MPVQILAQTEAVMAGALECGTLRGKCLLFLGKLYGKENDWRCDSQN